MGESGVRGDQRDGGGKDGEKRKGIIPRVRGGGSVTYDMVDVIADRRRRGKRRSVTVT